MTIPYDQRRLGKHDRKQDPRTVRLGDFVHGKLAPPPAIDWAKHTVGRFPLWGNDSISDCTCVAAGHLIELWTAVAKGDPTKIGAPAVLSAYAAVSGYDPHKGTHDHGAHMLDVLKHWRRHGIGGHPICGYAYVDPSDRAELSSAVAAFGGAYLGFKLPLTAKRAGVWDVPKEGLVRDGAFGSWGGHTVCVVGFDHEGVTVATFGERQRVTWAFVEAYSDEAYAVVSEDFVRVHTHKTPSGFAIEALLQDLRRFDRDAVVGTVPLDAHAPSKQR
ncbi:MAG: hypothetical protein ACHREM_03570 [Polyangiales bacterium]